MTSRIIITDRNNNIVVSDADFSEYVFEIDTFNIAAAFDLTLSNIKASPSDVKSWYGVTFIVERTEVFKGVIQRRTRSGEKGRIDVKVSGKNRSSILVESYFTNFKDYRNEHPTTIIDKMIQQTAFYPQPVTNAQNAVSVSDWDNATDINEFNSAIDDAIRGNKAFISRKNKTEYSSDFKKLSNKSHFKIEVGDTVFSRINELVSSYGYDVIYQQDGTLFIGDISKKRVNESPQVKHNLRLSENEDITNVIGWDISEDTSALYSSVTVVSQSQNGTNKSSTAKDSTVLDKKNQVIQVNEDDISPQDLAIRVREDNKISSARYSYRMGDHVDEVGVPFGVNRTAIVNDSHNDINGEFVIYNTTFSFSLTEGYTTELVLSYPRRKGLNV